MFVALETLSLGMLICFGIVMVLGNMAYRFTGIGILGNLFPFLIGVLSLIVASSLFLLGWWRFRPYLKAHSLALPSFTAVSLTLCLGIMIGFSNLNLSANRFRTLVGGKEEAGRITLTHQVFAAYRRYSPANLATMIARAQTFKPAIEEAAAEYDVDPDLLYGIAAAESSFLPRDSSDGGHGLFQITSVPKRVLEDTRERLNTPNFSLRNPKANAFIAAATFKHYLNDMKNDLYLALLAYNIGPSNGGLRFIMEKYGVTDFITIQPYLQLLPRDYPIRVLSYTLAFRIWQKHGKLLAYEKEDNALLIQQIGLPDWP